jgi:hypothetical protein
MGLMLLSLMSSPVLHAGTSTGNGPKAKSRSGTLRIVNHTDDAIGYSLQGGGYIYIEPLESFDLRVTIVAGSSVERTLTVVLASDESISAQTVVTIKANTITTATVTSSVSGSTVELHIAVEGNSKGNSKK